MERLYTAMGYGRRLDLSELELLNADDEQLIGHESPVYANELRRLRDQVDYLTSTGLVLEDAERIVMEARHLDSATSGTRWLPAA